MATPAELLKRRLEQGGQQSAQPLVQKQPVRDAQNPAISLRNRLFQEAERQEDQQDPSLGQRLWEVTGGPQTVAGYRGVLGNVGRSFVAGIGDVLATAGSALDWIGADRLAETLQERGRSLQERYETPRVEEFTWRSLLDPQFWTSNVVRSVPFTLSLIPAAVLGAAAGSQAGAVMGLGAFGRTVLGSIGAAGLSRPIEAALEAGGVYEEARRRGMPEEEADRAADQVFRRNLALMGLDAAQLAAAFVRLPPAATMSGRAAMTVGRFVIPPFIEAGEELTQEAIQRSALGDPIEFDPQMAEAAAIGAIMGLGFSGAGSIYNAIKDRTFEKLPPNYILELERKIAELEAQGRSRQEAEQQVLDEIAGTEQGRVAIEEATQEVAAELAQQEATPRPVTPPVPPRPEVTQRPPEPEPPRPVETPMPTPPAPQAIVLPEEAPEGTTTPALTPQEAEVPPQGAMTPAEPETPATGRTEAPGGVSQAEVSSQSDDIIFETAIRLTRDEFAEVYPNLVPDGPTDPRSIADVHRASVESALRQGMEVPDAVLADYPDLAPRIVQVEAGTPESTPTVETEPGGLLDIETPSGVPDEMQVASEQVPEPEGQLRPADEIAPATPTVDLEEATARLRRAIDEFREARPQVEEPSASVPQELGPSGVETERVSEEVIVLLEEAEEADDPGTLQNIVDALEAIDAPEEAVQPVRGKLQAARQRAERVAERVTTRSSPAIPEPMVSRSRYAFRFGIAGPLLRFHPLGNGFWVTAAMPGGEDTVIAAVNPIWLDPGKAIEKGTNEKAKSELERTKQEYMRHMWDLANHLAATVENPNQVAVLRNEFGKYNTEYLRRLRGVLDARIQTQTDLERSRIQDLREWSNRALEQMQQRLAEVEGKEEPPAGSDLKVEVPEQPVEPSGEVPEVEVIPPESFVERRPQIEAEAQTIDVEILPPDEGTETARTVRQRIPVPPAPPEDPELPFIWGITSHEVSLSEEEVARAVEWARNTRDLFNLIEVRNTLREVPLDVSDPDALRAKEQAAEEIEHRVREVLFGSEGAERIPEHIQEEIIDILGSQRVDEPTSAYVELLAQDPELQPYADRIREWSDFLYKYVVPMDTPARISTWFESAERPYALRVHDAIDTGTPIIDVAAESVTGEEVDRQGLGPGPVVDVDPSQLAQQPDAPDIPVPVSPDDIPFEVARRAHLFNSMEPERRARQIQQEYVEHMRGVYEELAPIARTPEQQALLREEFERYREGYRNRLIAVLEARSRVASQLVTGPTRFPAERNRKAMEVEQRRIDELQQFSERAISAIRRRLTEARTPQQASDEEFERLRKKIDEAVAIIRGIESGSEAFRGYGRDLFKSNLAGMIQRSAANGNVEAVRRALDYLRQAQRGLKRPIFTDRHSIWNAVGQAEEAAAAQAEQTGEEEVARFQGARIVNNRDDERVRIFFDARPTETVVAELRGRGFRWSPSNQAWQRQNTPNAIATAREIVGRYYESETQTRADQPAPEPSPAAEPVAQGSTTTAATERGTEIEAQWAIVEASDLITSHDTALRPNSAFPQELQPRDRTRAASELQITRIVNTLRPEFLAESPKASEGAPIVGPDMIVESGNARTIALKRAYEHNAPTADQYRSFLVENAARFGLDPSAIQQAEQPVLVRIRRTDVDRRQFVVEANEGSVAAMSATEQAIADAERMSADLIAIFRPSEEGEILTPANREFISAFMQRIVSPADRGRLIDAAGRPSQEAIRRIQNAVFAKAYGDPAALAQLAESIDSNVRNITAGMLIAAPRMVDIKEGIRRGDLFDLDPTANIAAAMRKLSDLRAEGTPVDVYLRQATMFGDELGPLAKDFLQVFDTYKRSRQQIAKILQTYADIVEAAGNPKQETLFGDIQAPQAAEILQAAINKVESGYDPRTRQTSLFEDQPAPGARTGEPPGGVAPQGGRAASVPRAPTGETRGFPKTPGERVAHPRPAASRPLPLDRVVTRKEVIDYIEREFMMPVREGRMRLRRAAGEFNLRTHVTRLRRAEDMRALAHEFGHFLSETLQLQPENYAELEPLGASIYPDEDPMIQRMEGAAEFFYLYFTTPDEAKAAAPAFYTDWEKRLLADSKLKAKIDEAQNLFISLYSQTGTAAIKAAIVREEAKATPFLTPAQRFYTTWVDDLHPVFQAMKAIVGEEQVKSEWDVDISQNPYILGRLARGRFRKADAFVRRAQVSPDFEIVGPSLQEILKLVASRIEDFETYLVALRAVELHGRGIDPGVSLEDAKKAVRELESPEFQRAKQELVEYQNNLVDHLIDAGVVSQETANLFRELNKDYVPFYRFFGEETAAKGLTGSRLKWGNLPQPIKAIRGSTRSIYSPLQSIMRNTYTMIDIAERNRAARALAELADQSEGMGWLIEEVPTPFQPNTVVLEELRKDLIEAGVPEDALEEADLNQLAVIFRPVSFARFKETRENILTIYRDGRTRFYQLHPELYRAMQFLDQPSSHLFFRILRPFTRLLRAGATLNLDFSPRNLARDQFSALMNRKYRFVPVIDPARAMFSAIRGNLGLGDELYDLWVASGAAQSTMVSLNRDYLEKDLRALIGRQTTGQKALRALRSPLTALEVISSVLEESTRLAQFRSGLRAEGLTPEAVRRAAFASREISVDFQRAGSAGRQWNQVQAFFNAAIQGTDQVARLWRRDPKTYTLRAFLYITLPTIALYLINKDDPRYQELQQWRKDLFWVIITRDRMYFIPKPFEIGVLFGALPERIMAWVAENDPNAFEDFVESVIETTTPFDASSVASFALSIVPDALTPIVEVYANRRRRDDQPIVPASEKDLEPWAQYGLRTSEVAKRIGWLTGVSPRQVDHLIQGYTAGLGRHVLRFIDRLAGVESDSPIINPFGGDPFVSAVSLDEFYRELDRLERQERTARTMIQRGQAPPPGYEGTAAQLRFYRQIRDRLAEARRSLRMIEENRSIPIPEKRRISDAITLGMLNMARAALGKPPILIDEEGRFVQGSPAQVQGGMAQTIQETLRVTQAPAVAPSQRRSISDILREVQ